MRPLIRILNLALVAVMVILSLSPAALSRNNTPRYNWLQFNGDPQHSGNNRSETFLTPANVSQLAQLFQVSLPSAFSHSASATALIPLASSLIFLWPHVNVRWSAPLFTAASSE